MRPQLLPWCISTRRGSWWEGMEVQTPLGAGLETAHVIGAWRGKGESLDLNVGSSPTPVISMSRHCGPLWPALT